MKALINHQKKLIDQNRKEYGMYYDQLPKAGYYKILEAETQRAAIVSGMNEKEGYLFNGTKPFIHDVSPGCKLCGEGQWSCLFVNNRCNCNCFYCPAPQVDAAIPETQGLTFSDPKDYTAYIRKFGFKGVSLSGGEPLLTFDTTVKFISEIRKEFGDEVYLWMYTNGTLLTKEKVKILAAAGLNEIRFDITATKYSTKKLQLALGVIPNVTVEIPAIPDEMEELKKAVKELDRLGVSFLNLHQIRLTPYNLKNLLQRNYTFLHGQKVTVMESELAALEIIRFVIDNNLRLPVNYCSFHFKNHYQKAAFRKKAATQVLLPYEEINGNGYIRTIAIHGLVRPLNGIEDQLTCLSSEGKGWYRDQGRETLYISKEMLLRFRPMDEPLYVEYHLAISKDKPAKGFKETGISGNKKVYITKEPTGPVLKILPGNLAGFYAIFEGSVPETVFDSDTLFEVFLKEMPAKGFAEYF